MTTYCPCPALWCPCPFSQSFQAFSGLVDVQDHLLVTHPQGLLPYPVLMSMIKHLLFLCLFQL